MKRIAKAARWSMECGLSSAAAMAMSAPDQHVACRARSVCAHQRIVGTSQNALAPTCFQTAPRKSEMGRIPLEPRSPSICRPQDTNAVR